MQREEKKAKLFTLVTGLGLVALAAVPLAGCMASTSNVTQTTSPTTTTTTIATSATPTATIPATTVTTNDAPLADSQKAAEDYIKHDPTFVFDGIPDTLKLGAVYEIPDGVSWMLTYNFDSRQAGYGDRTGQALAQVITPHTVVINLTNAQIISAIMDGKWNMQTQQREYSQEETQAAAEAFVKGEATYTFDGQPDTFKVRKVATTGQDYRWMIIIEFSSRHPGYGDRTGQALAQVVTPHSVQLFVDRGQVVAAVMDGKWDMMTEKW
jgi:hypothetical protein